MFVPKKKLKNGEKNGKNGGSYYFTQEELTILYFYGALELNDSMFCRPNRMIVFDTQIPNTGQT